jgi:diguanylate cyclase (GGDEF)-like protein
MTWMVTPASLALWSTAAVALIVALIALRQRPFPGSRAFPFLMLAIAEWALCSGLEAAAVPLASRVLMSQLEYIGFAATPVLFLLFAARHSGHDRWLRGSRRVVLWLPAIAAVVLAATNSLHRWLWADFVPGPAGSNAIIYEHGPAYYVIAAGVFVFVLAGCALVARAAVRHSGVRRRQALTILVASAFPLAAGVLYVVDVSLVPGLDLIPVSFLVTGLVFLVGIGVFRVFDLVPAARNTLVEQTPDPVIVADADGRIVDANPAAARWLGLSVPLAGLAVDDILARWPALGSACHGAQARHVELTLTEDPLLHVDVHVSPLQEPGGRRAGCFVVLRDITERYRSELEIQRVNLKLAEQIREIEALHDELREQAIRDSLTGLANRRYLDEVLPRELARAKRSGATLSVVMIDIDHFKAANDLYGHHEGDRLLALLGNVLEGGTRPSDTACRYGGEEFLLVLPGTLPEVARDRVEALRAEYVARLRADGLASPPTLSAGVAAFPVHASSDEELLRSADKALYRAKAQGRNCVCVSEDTADA